MSRQSFLGRLAQDATANVIAISAAAMIPLVAMVGGGVDASRYYMTDSRLQAACDAGALAARRAMGKEDWASEYNTIANNFFDQNYTDGMFGIESLSRTYNGDSDGVVTGTVTGNLPTSLMSIFGYDEFQLSVTCEADINIANTDIVFVLDVTGSMACKPDGTSCNSGSDSKIQALREAAANFYDTVDSATGDRAQVRYGIVPYSNAVNLGPIIMDENSSWMATQHVYQSKIANFTTTTSWEDTGAGPTLDSVSFIQGYWYTDDEYTWYTGYNSSSCSAARPADIPEVIPSNFDLSGGTVVSNSGGNPRTITYQIDDAWIEYWDGFSYYWGSGWCALGHYIYDYQADITYTTTEEEVTETVFNNYTYGPIGTLGTGETYEWTSVDLEDLYDDSTIDLPIGYRGALVNVSWNGCIEEAATDEGQTNFDPVPAAAKDLDIDLVPASEDERWKPVLNNAFIYRYSGSNYTNSVVTTSSNWTSSPTDYCPKAARKLDPFDSKADLESYLSAANGFEARGATYHDIGMIWGARLISPDGIFSADNQVGPDGNGISRHIVFMTDGQMSTNVTSVYTPYGVEYWDRRITTDGNGTTASTNHAARFQAACEAARNKNISVWVIAFGTTLTSNLTDCASSGRAYHADNNDELDQSFSEIAEKIAQLRLTA